MNDRYNIQNQTEILQMKYVGTGHSDMTKWEWGTNMQRDSLASHIGHSSRLLYFSVAENVNPARMRVKFLNVVYASPEKMVQPVGPPPAKDNDTQLFPS